jgi:uncharacterized protein YyaL (SSP411 family)
MSAQNPSYSNRLVHETSPYLLQHAHNPVDWYAWGPEALERARAENKPILLSIGYSACHWCHVMAHESFEDPATAAVMNELFVNIKVDREERPDLDRIYQLAHQLLVRHGGGWPLTMFLAPHDLQPFFGGTYFPKESRHGLPAFTDLLKRIAEFYNTRTDDIRAQSDALKEALVLTLPPPSAPDVELTLAPLVSAREMLARDFDPEFGGFGSAPKFPHPTNLEFLLREWRRSAGSEAPDLHSLYMATLTLARMAEGGIYDQLGGGFARYSVDRYWMIPHFEKMLYDNAQLLALYAQAGIATGDVLFSRVANETADWMLREMRSPEGGFWSALDADSEGHEGKFYAWDADEVRRLLPQQTFDVFARRFGLDRPPNFENQWHLHAYSSLEDIANDLGLCNGDIGRHLEQARNILLQARDARVRPARDEKVLTAWNGLAIGALAIAARSLRRPEIADAALRAIDFVRDRLWDNGRLLAAYKDSRARFPAYLDDYAFLLDALLESLQTQWRTRDLDLARALADTLIEHFEDAAHGGFFFTADDHETLIHRAKSFSDEALPAGNAIAARALTRLGLLLGEPRYLDVAARTLRAGWASLEHYPHAHGALLLALEDYVNLPTVVIIRGAADEAAQWRDELAKLYAPKRLVFAIPSDADGLPAALADKCPSTETVAYVCRGMTCSEPLRSLAALAATTHSI